MHNAQDAQSGQRQTPSVFISGSISIRHPLPKPVVDRLDVIVDRKMPVLLGDAAGVDEAVQTYLDMRAARDVTIFSSGPAPRHNVGDWPIRWVRADARSGTREWHMAKDREMARLADSGLVVWDGSSPGSFANIERLSQRGCYILVYLYREQRFAALHTDAERYAFLHAHAGSIRRRRY